MWDAAKGIAHLLALIVMIGFFYVDKPLAGVLAGFGLLALGHFFRWLADRRSKDDDCRR